MQIVLLATSLYSLVIFKDMKSIYLPFILLVTILSVGLAGYDCFKGSGLLYAETVDTKINLQQVQKAADLTDKVLVRAAKHHNYFRIVLETSDANTQKTSVLFGANNTIVVDFLSAVTVSNSRGDIVKQGTPLELVKGVRITGSSARYVLNVDGLDDISVSKLGLPSRIVIDAYFVKSSQQPKQEGQAVAPIPAAVETQLLFNSIVIDPGHGGADIGITGQTFKEKDFALTFSRDMAAIVARKGKTAILTRKTDQSLSLSDRIKTANKKSPDIFLSFHVSSKPEFVIYTYQKALNKMSEEGQSASVLTEDNAESVLAKNMAIAIKNELAIDARHLSVPLPMLKYTSMPAFIVELPSPDHFKYDKKVREKLMLAIIRGLKTNE
ncbi:MAG: N-acetylmuramoyl-L-alanine amidase [Dissulfurispiraceae bacterium]|nr:N-acetylmuramoyl-L-alanine amidase [Dissulfurispiraceae bacterium]